MDTLLTGAFEAMWHLARAPRWLTWALIAGAGFAVGILAGRATKRSDTTTPEPCERCYPPAHAPCADCPHPLGEHPPDGPCCRYCDGWTPITVPWVTR